MKIECQQNNAETRRIVIIINNNIFLKAFSIRIHLFVPLEIMLRHLSEDAGRLLEMTDSR